jgi:hypothetical protein
MPDRKRQLQDILLSYASTNEQRDLCEKIFTLMVADGQADVTIETQIVGAISDGLRYENWPWTIPTRARW